MKVAANVIKRTYDFSVKLSDGTAKVYTVEAESKIAAKIILNRILSEERAAARAKKEGSAK